MQPVRAGQTALEVEHIEPTSVPALGAKPNHRHTAGGWPTARTRPHGSPTSMPPGGRCCIFRESEHRFLINQSIGSSSTTIQMCRCTRLASGIQKLSGARSSTIGSACIRRIGSSTSAPGVSWRRARGHTSRTSRRQVRGRRGDHRPNTRRSTAGLDIQASAGQMQSRRGTARLELLIAANGLRCW